MWESSDTNVVEITPYGNDYPYERILKIKKPGKATITVSYGDKKASAEIEVSDELRLTGVTVSAWIYEGEDYRNVSDAKNIDALVGGYIYFDLIALPSNVQLPRVTWETTGGTLEYYGNDYCDLVLPGTPGDITLTADIEGYPDLKQTINIKVLADDALEYLSFNSSGKQETANYGYSIATLPETRHLDVYKYPATSNANVTWSITGIGDDFAAIDENGVLTFKPDLLVKLQKSKKTRTGAMQFTAKAGRAGAEKTAVLSLYLVDDTNVLSLTLDKFGTVPHDIMKDGATLQLQPSVVSDSIYMPLITWKSSSAAVATVDADGIVTFLKAGTATITATTYNKKTAKVIFKVTDSLAPTGVQLSPAGTTTVKVNEIRGIEAGLLPLQGTTFSTLLGANATVTWTASGTTKDKKSVVTFVGEDGSPVASPVVSAFEAEYKSVRIKGLNAGTAKITAKTGNGKSATLTVTVVADTAAEFKSYAFNMQLVDDANALPPGALELLNTKLTAIDGETFNIEADKQPADASNAPAIAWSVKGSALALGTDDNTYQQFTAKATGKATITAKYGKTTKTWSITVIKLDAVNAIALDVSGTQELKVGQRLELDYNITPDTVANRALAASKLRAYPRISVRQIALDFSAHQGAWREA